MEPIGIEDLGGFLICRACLDPCEQPRSRARPLQRCGCGRPEPRWTGFDFNERVHLCECCRMVTLTSGSKWSVWYCAQCKTRVMGLNRDVGRTVIPIGRHSLMAGVGFGGPALLTARDAGDAAVQELLTGFHAGMMDWIESIDHLHAWSNQRLAWLLDRLDLGDEEDVPLPAFLNRLRDSAREDPELTRAEAFRSLVEHFG